MLHLVNIKTKMPHRFQSTRDAALKQTPRGHDLPREVNSLVTSLKDVLTSSHRASLPTTPGLVSGKTFGLGIIYSASIELPCWSMG